MSQTNTLPAPTVDSVVKDHATRIENVVNAGTVGDSTFLGLLMEFLMDLSPVIGVNLLRGRQVSGEPSVSSVVMVHGDSGTAYQRLRDGLWHSTTGRAVSWGELLTAAAPRLPILLHDPSQTVPARPLRRHP